MLRRQWIADISIVVIVFGLYYGYHQVQDTVKTKQGSCILIYNFFKDILHKI